MIRRGVFDQRRKRARDARRMRGARPAAVAGLFYPAVAGELRRAVAGYLEGAAAEVSGPPPVAVIAPHAGYPYSGPIAGSSFDPWRASGGEVERVVVLGPSHRVAFDGLALPAAEVFETPLGPVAVDREAAARVLELEQVFVDAVPHAQEHALEVELPFLREVLGEVPIVPLVVGRASAEEVAAVIDALWDGGRSRFVLSSDLSHFLSWAQARRVDAETAGKIVALDAVLRPEEACGAAPINGFLRVAARRGLEARLLDLRSSGDTAGDRSRVVGYGAFVFTETAAGVADA